jgi:hypothetical protein
MVEPFNGKKYIFRNVKKDCCTADNSLANVEQREKSSFLQ